MKRFFSPFCFFVCFFVLQFLSILFISCTPKASKKLSFEAMDTIMSIQSYGRNADEANQKAKKTISDIEALISVNLEGSDIYKINHARVFPQKINASTAYLVNYSIEIADKSDGIFNPALYPVTESWGFTTGNYRVPSKTEIDDLLKLTDYKKINIKNNQLEMADGMKLDLGGIGKGFAGDKAIEILKNEGIESAILDLGGNVQTLGSKSDGSPWKIGIKNPFGGEVCAVVKVENKAVITSGGYERFFKTDDGKIYIHIFDSKTGYPVENNVASCTIISEKGVYADSLSTTLFALGKEKAIDFWKKYSDFDFIMIFDDNSILYTEKLKSNLELLQNFTAVQVVK